QRERGRARLGWHGLLALAGGEQAMEDLGERARSVGLLENDLGRGAAGASALERAQRRRERLAQILRPRLREGQEHPHGDAERLEPCRERARPLDALRPRQRRCESVELFGWQEALLQHREQLAERPGEPRLVADAVEGRPARRVLAGGLAEEKR